MEIFSSGFCLKLNFKFQFNWLTNRNWHRHLRTYLYRNSVTFSTFLIETRFNVFATGFLIRWVEIFRVFSWCFRTDLYESRIGDHINSPFHLISHGSVITNVTLIPIKITKTKITKFLSVLFRATQTMLLRNPFMITIPAILLNMLVDTFPDKRLDIPSRRYPTADLIQLQCEK